MSPRESSIFLPSNYTPLQRILLTANGNVQRILSSFYNSPVVVHIKYNRKIENGINEVGVTYDRQVELKCMHRVIICRFILFLFFRSVATPSQLLKSRIQCISI